MKFKAKITLLFITLAGCVSAFAQTTTYQQGTQITTQDKLVSGRPYLFYYVGNNSAYVKATESYFQAQAGDFNATDETIFYFISDGAGKWKIQSRATSKYFPVPTHSETNFAPVEDANAGLWTMNFLDGGNLAPYSYNSTTSMEYSLNRYSGKLHGWDKGEADVNQFRIYEIKPSATPNTDFDDKEVRVSNTSESPTTGGWYVMKNGSGNYFVDSATESYISATSPRGMSATYAKYLVRLTDAGDGKYYVETGYGNYLFTGNTTTAIRETKYAISDLSDWTFYPASAVDPLRPTATEVFAINEAGNWMFSPTGFGTYQYYLFNIDQNKFAYPTGTFSTSAVPVILESQGDGTYQILTKDGQTKVVSDAAMTITKKDNATEAQIAALNTALGKLLAGQTKITETSQIAVGWYALRIHSDENDHLRDGNFIYTLPSENWYKGRPHPMSQGGEYLPHPADNDATYYVRLWPIEKGSETYYHWQVPNGKYVVNHLNDFPITWNQPASDFIIGKNTDGTFYIQSSGYRAQVCLDDHDVDFLGRTARKNMESVTKLDIYKIDVDGLGLQPWQVKFNEGADDIKVKYSGTDVSGLTDVYNHGYIFLPKDVTPTSDQFTFEGMSGTPAIDASDHSITVKYAPTECMTANNITIVQGARTAGVGNTMQALLRMEVSPTAPCNPKSFTVNLSGAANFVQTGGLKAYLTTADQLRADNDMPVLLGSTDIRATEDNIDGDYTINVETPTSHLMKMNETYYIWITADIKNVATVESEVVDASISSFTYQNASDTPEATTLDISSKGAPEGNMRIFMKQDYVWVSSEKNANDAHYYRNPAILNIDENTILFFSEYRYDNVNGLGKDYDGTDYGHRIDVVMRKYSKVGDTWTWSDPKTIAAGTETGTISGYSTPAVVKKGSTIICLMSAGAAAYDSSAGLQQIAMITSSDNGDTWSDPTNIWGSISWNGVAHYSAYVTAGKGLVYGSPEAIAFVLNVKSSATSGTKEYRLYSEDGGSTWTVDPTPLSGKGIESKLEAMNDGSLYVTGKKPASMQTNNDVLYFSRGTGTSDDALLQTVIWKNDGDPQRLRDMRLYASFDQTTTWQQLFVITPGNAATSSMQKLSDGNLAIFFEDGSIGNDEKDGCYALNYVVIANDMVKAQTGDLMTATIIRTGITDGSAPYVNGSGWTKSVVTNNKSDFPGIVISTNHTAFNREGNGTQRVFDLRPSGASATDVITIKAPEGYVIKDYHIIGYNKGSETYTLTAADGETTANFNGGKSAPSTLTVNNIFAPSTTFTFQNNSGSNNSYALITEFQITLARDNYGVKLNRVTPTGGKSYATLYTDRDLRQTDETTKAYYITEVTDGKAVLTLTNNEGRDIPNHTAVLLVNSEGSTYTEFTIVNNMTQVVTESDNLLKGYLEAGELDMATHQNYYSFGRRKPKDASEDTYVAGFYNNSRVITLGANRAYLDTSAAPSTTTAKGFDLSFDENGSGVITAIDELIAPVQPETKAPEGWYTLDGRKLNGKPTVKGLYICNGRKYIIK